MAPGEYQRGDERDPLDSPVAIMDRLHAGTMGASPPPRLNHLRPASLLRQAAADSPSSRGSPSGSTHRLSSPLPTSPFRLHGVGAEGQISPRERPSSRSYNPAAYGSPNVASPPGRRSEDTSRSPTPSTSSRRPITPSKASPLLRMVPRSARSEREAMDLSFLDNAPESTARDSGSDDDAWSKRGAQHLEPRGPVSRSPMTAPWRDQQRVSRDIFDGVRAEEGRSTPSTSIRSVAITDDTICEGDSETHSLASAASIGSRRRMSSGSPSKEARSSRRELLREEGERDRPRQKESIEWTQSCWAWTVEKSGTSSGGGILSKTPLGGPSTSKWKLGKRDSSQSSQLLSTVETPASLEENRSSGGPRSKDKSTKASFAIGPSSTNKEGAWKKVTAVLRDDGYIRIFNDNKITLHSIHLPSRPRTDVHVVNQSLFGRPHCIVLHRHTLPSTSTSGDFLRSASPSSTNVYNNASSSPGGARTPEEPLYLCMPSQVIAETWIVMSRCFARPEVFTAGVQRTRTLSSAQRYDEDDSTDEGGDEEGDSPCRIYRSITLSITEGRGIGELGTEVMRSSARASMDRKYPAVGRDGTKSTTSSVENFHLNATESLGSSGSKSSSSPRILPRTTGEAREREESVGSSDQIFCELLLEGEVRARTSCRKGTTSPLWNENFSFDDLAHFTQPLTINVYQIRKVSRPVLLGTSTIRIADLPRAESILDWWPIKPVSTDIRGKATDTLGELSISIKINEDVVLSKQDYSVMLRLLDDDPAAELALELAHEFSTELEDLSKLLVRIYKAQGCLIPRILRLAELEIDGDVSSVAILFRQNSILTKSLEQYLRLVGAEYLEASIGEPVRRLCAEGIDLEIDPSRMKPGYKEKELNANIQGLKEWTMAVWTSIYDAREKCPSVIREIFAHIQRLVTEKYGEEHQKVRSTSVSAFIFLRFFVPAVLNPKLFSLVDTTPDPKAQRTLTLIAKSLQRLANFYSGLKEAYFESMNSFVQNNSSSFVDFIQHISTPTPSYHAEWTSSKAGVYQAPYHLRNSLPTLVREGVPLLPHLLDLPRDLGLLTSHVVRGGRSTTNLDQPPRRSARYVEFLDACVDAHDEARRRGGGLVASLPVAGLQGSTKIKARAATNRRGISRSRSTLDDMPTTPPGTIEEVSSIRNSYGSPRALSPETDKSSVASRRSHRSFTIGGLSSRDMPLMFNPEDDFMTAPTSPLADSFRRPSIAFSSTSTSSAIDGSMGKVDGKATIDYLSMELPTTDETVESTYDAPDSSNASPIPHNDNDTRSSTIPRSLGKLFGNKPPRE